MLATSAQLREPKIRELWLPLPNLEDRRQELTTSAQFRGQKIREAGYL
jgi:hypothetical protein